MYWNKKIMIHFIHRYINGVKPGQYGIPKPFYFPCLPSYWSGAPRKSEIVEVRYLNSTTMASIGYDMIYATAKVNSNRR